ncbi:hypothetical protein CAP36_13355 [Chitinophagaceae bacterium IBVUCB2]|nr:hypothetical protein CAP36_13355 [Chitinophagaceae bacterium IBVUCB2]
MDQNQNSSLFELGVSSDAKSHLGEAAKWARFLAICGMITLVLMVIFGIIASLAVSKASSEYEDLYRQQGMSTAGLGVGMMFVYILFALLYFFPCLFTLQFANKMKLALTSGDDLMLAESFRSLKKTFRYLGILTIIGLAFFIMALVTGGMAALTA